MRKKVQPTSLLLHAPIGSLLINKKQLIIQANYEFAKIIGNKPRKSYYEKTVISVMGAAVTIDMRPYIQRAFAGEIISEVSPFKFVTQIGTIVYLSASYIPVKTAQVITAVGVLLRDVTEQKNTEEALEKYRERLYQAQKAGKLGVFEWNINTNKIWWSDEEEALFGVYPGQFKGQFKDWTSAIYKADRNMFLEEIKKSLKKGHELDIDFRVKHPGNVIHWLKVKGHIYRENTIPIRMTGIHYDITARKQQEELLAFKAEASRVLSSSLDYRATLTTMAHLAVTHIADWCSVDMIDEETNKVLLVTALHRNPAKAKWAQKIREKYPVDMNLTTGLPAVLKSGTSLLVPFISPDELMKSAKTHEQREILQKLGGINSIIIVPINLNKKTIGAITFVSSESKRQYTKQDLQMAEQLASRASLAIENSQLYETVNAERERLDNLLDNVPAIVWEAWGSPASPTQTITYISSYAERLLGYSRVDWLTKPNFWKTIMHPDDQENATLIAKENFEKRDQGVSRFRWMTQDQKPIWVESQSFIIKNVQGQPVGMRGIVLDISERMKEVRRKDEFISLASHEIKTPITTIKAYSQLLQGIIHEPKPLQYLTKMDQQLQKLIRLVSELLDVSKIQEGKLELHAETFWLDEFLTDLLTDLQTINKTHRIKTKIKTHVQVTADRDRLSQVIINLITNAVKYSPESNHILVTSAHQGKKSISIAVQDFGIGIDKKDQVQIFTRFYRVQNGVDVSGLGIGLFISKEIIKRHNGDLSLESERNSGATFTIRLPII